MPFDTFPESQSLSAANARPRCDLCPAAAQCPVGGTSREERACWNAALGSQIALPVPGKVLADGAAPLQALYVVRAGCLKSFTIDEQGHEHVRAFYLPGDVIGLDAMGLALYPATVAAITASQVCRMSIAELRLLLLRTPALTQHLIERMSRDLAGALALSGDYTAEQRVAAFLLSMERRLHAAGQLRLPMPRRDIASYLRLATETVCRVLTRFEDSGLITSDNKIVRVLDADGLRGLAQPIESPVLRAA